MVPIVHRIVFMNYWLGLVNGRRLVGSLRLMILYCSRSRIQDMLGDLKFGHLTFIMIMGILVRDLFPDPDIVCQFLNENQWQWVTWFYEWILKSLEGVEVKEQDPRDALTRSQMICSLRYQDERSMLSKIPPPWIILWSRMVGSWPSIAFGGCRFVLQARIWFEEQLRMLQRARIMWNNNLVIQRLTIEMEISLT